VFATNKFLRSINMVTDKTALILGATGGIGGEVAHQLLIAGWKIRALTRGSKLPDEQPDSIDWVCGDAMNRKDVLAAAKGCSVIVHAVNPAGYKDWATLVLPMIDNSIAAAIENRATILLPGTIYNYGTSAFPVLREDSPQQPKTEKGLIRVELERRLHVASFKGCRVIIVRAGDFFGPKVGNNWFSQGMVKPAQPVTAINLPGAKGVGHQWSYLPDVAQTMVQLLNQRQSLSSFETFHMAGHWDPDGTKMAEAISNTVTRCGGEQPKLKSFPWWFITLTSPFNATFRALGEMRYLWKTPIRMTNDHLLTVLGEEPHTPLDIAVLATLEGLGCLTQNK
jgi:nucleoside-diphosphate-sugar epimerase